MRKSWFYKLLFSYLPLFLIIIILLSAVFFMSMGEISRNAANTVTKGSTKHMMEIIDQSLGNIEQMMIKEIDTSEEFNNFYYDWLNPNPYYTLSEPSSQLNDLVTRNSLIHSIYLVRWEDGMVLSDASASDIEQYGDKEFIQRIQAGKAGTSWSQVRSFKEYSYQSSDEVVTLVRNFPVLSDGIGVMVVNVKADSITKLVSNVIDSTFIQAHLFDQADQLIFPKGEKVISDIFDQSVQVKSNYTGWLLEAQIVGGPMYYFASRFIYVLLGSGLIAIILSIAVLTYVTRRNYRPLQSLADRVDVLLQNTANQLLKPKGKNDEFSIIESALDKMVEQATEFNELNEERKQLKQKQVFQELVEGTYPMSSDNWLEVAKILKWEPKYEKAVAVVLEIDRYNQFYKNLSKRDQSLFKFVIVNTIGELGQKHNLEVLGEWTTANQWCALYPMSDHKSIEDLVSFQNEILFWVKEHLDFTVTLGIGEKVDGFESHISYEQALNALQFKISIGTERIIHYSEVVNNYDGKLLKNVFDVRSLVHAFKQGDSAWRPLYLEFIRELKSTIYKKDELVNFINYIIYQLTREITDFGEEYVEFWHQEVLPSINDLLSEFETLEELEINLQRILEEAQGQLSEKRIASTHSDVLIKVREYIQENYNSPDMSLDFLGDIFQMNPKSLSQQFKKEFGEKFVDYLAEVRVEKAKELLIETKGTVQEISEQVGYNHSFSFIRAFKKVVGLTPGDYRKNTGN